MNTNGNSYHNCHRAEDSVNFVDEDESLVGWRRIQVAKQWRKLKIPLFHEDGAFSWLDLLERYFEARGVPEGQWLYGTKVAMEEKTVTWFRWWEENATFQSLPIFKNAVTKQLQPEFVQNPFEMLLGIKQEGTVREC